MIINEGDYLAHRGTPRHSGRYPWGSGDNETEHRNPTLNQEVARLKRLGMSEPEIAKGQGYPSTTALRAAMRIEGNARKADKIAEAERLIAKGMSVNAAAKQMGEAESTVRSYLKPGAKDKQDALTTTANMLKSQVDEKGFIDVGSGVENRIGVSKSRLSTAVEMLRAEGYELHSYKVPQVTGMHDTTMKVLGKPGSTQKEVWMNPELIQQVSSRSVDGGRKYDKPGPPLSLNPKRLDIVYGAEGAKADGVIYVRPGVKDVELGSGNYAQVRVKVGNNHYIKGMAVYKDDLPDGVDLQFNTGKKDTGKKVDALKPLHADPNLPFGSIVRQIPDIVGNPGAKPTSVMNIVNDDSDWDTWSRTLSQQFLSKQDPHLTKSQLDMTYERREIELANIKRLTNPTVRKKLLEDFAGSTDSAVVHLKAAAMPRQAVKVILPVNTLKPNEVYAPGFKQGEKVVLIRHPHGGTFEIPELVVNKNHADSKKLLGIDPPNAIGINHEVAKRLSGADFDGDTVLIIPNKAQRITHTRALESLKDFDPISAYPGYEGMKVMSNTQTEMGKISNLITDMTLKQAPQDEIARAVRHSMVVIDAENKKLDHRKSAQDNNIKQLKEKYQRNPDTGTVGAASTLLSRRKYEERVPQRKDRSQKLGGPIDKVTGERMYEPTGKTSWKTGELLPSRVPRIELTSDAHTLSSGTPTEILYANHANKLKALANQARLEAVHTPRAGKSASAKKIYKAEVNSLNGKLNTAKSNSPLERQAQLLANSQLRLKKAHDPTMDKKTLKKVKYQTLEEMRRRTGADKIKIKIEPKEWEAIQAGAISDSNLSEILTHADMKRVRELATPKTQILMTPATTARAQQMLAQGYTRADVAEHLGVSITTLDVGVTNA